MSPPHQLGGVTCGNEPVALRAVPGAGPGTRKPGNLSGALALLVAVPLAACEADHIGARATLQDWGYRGVGITAGPTLGRPCRWSEPFAVRFTAHDERGEPAAGWLCASDEAAEDARILLDREGA